MIRYEHGPGERPAHAGAPAGDWIRLIPFALAYPRVVVSTRAERDGFVYLDDVYDLKLTGDEDLLGRGPNLLVSDDFVRAYRAGGFEGLALHEAQHATPHTIRVRRPWRCRPTHHATAVTERVVLVPATHPKGRPYGHHGRPSEPLEILAPAPAAGRFFGGPWFATASLPFQPLIAPAGFLASFRATVGREPSFGWADVSIIADDTGVPFCEWNQACVGGACVSPPLVRDAGTLSIDGGGSGGSIAVPFEDGFYQRFDQTLRFPPGATLTVSAPGADFAAFSFAAVAPAPLTLVGIDELRLRTGTPMTIRWQPADPGSRVRVTMGADLGHAFFRSVVVECDAPDEHGAITVPQHMVDRLADPQHWGCGDCFSQEVRRYRRARTTAGSVPLDLWLNQIASFYLYPER